MCLIGFFHRVGEQIGQNSDCRTVDRDLICIFFIFSQTSDRTIIYAATSELTDVTMQIHGQVAWLLLTLRNPSPFQNRSIELLMDLEG